MVNLRILYEAGKVQNVILEMKRLDLQILGVSETHWLESGSFKTNDYTVHFSGAKNGLCQKGVSDKCFSKCVKIFMLLSERVIMVQFVAHSSDSNVIQVHARTTTEYEEIY